MHLKQIKLLNQNNHSLFFMAVSVFSQKIGLSQPDKFEEYQTLSTKIHT